MSQRGNQQFPLTWETGLSTNLMEFVSPVFTIEGDRTPTAQNLSAQANVSAGQICLVPMFTGEDGTRIETFLERLRIVSNFSSWSEAQTLGVARLRLAGVASEFAENNAYVVASYSDFCKYMKDRFSPKLSRPTLEKMFNDCSQKHLESISDFASRLASLERQLRSSYNNPDAAATKAMFEERLLAQFLAGLREEIGRFVSVRNPKTMLEAVAFAKQEEAIARNYASATRTVNSLNSLGGDPLQGYAQWATMPQSAVQNSFYAPNPPYGYTQQATPPQPYVPVQGSAFPSYENVSEGNRAHSSVLPFGAGSEFFAIQQPSRGRNPGFVQQPPPPRQSLAARVCYHCGKPGHFSRDCPEKKQKCFNCGQADHNIRKCPLIICSKCKESGHCTVDCQKRDVNSGN